MLLSVSLSLSKINKLKKKKKKTLKLKHRKHTDLMFTVLRARRLTGAL